MDNTNTPTTKGMGRAYGRSGTQIFNGYITAEEYNRRLQGKSAIRQFEIMRRSDPTVHQTLQVCILPLLRAIWDMQPASDDENDKYIARFVKNELIDGAINWSNHVRESAGGLLAFGFSVFEKTYQLTEFEGKPRIGFKELGSRKQISIEKWEMEDGRPGITQQLVGTDINRANIPAPKLVIYTNDKEGDNVEGISLLRYAFKDWDMKDKLGRVLAVGLEKTAIPTPVLSIPEGQDGSQDVANAIEAIRQWRSNEEAFIKKPHGWELDKLDMSGQSTKEILPALQYHDRQIVRTVLAQFLEIGSAGSSGSFAASDNQSNLFIKSLEALAENIRATAQEHIVKQLCDLNFSDLPNGYPKLTFSRVGDDDMTKLADAVQKFQSAGLLTTTFETEQHVRSITNLPELPEDYKDDFDEKREQAKKAAKALADGAGDDSLEENDDPNKTKKTGEKDKTIKASIADAKKARRQLIDIIVRQ